MFQSLTLFAFVIYEFLAAMFSTIIIGALWERGTSKTAWAILIVGWGAGITAAFFASLVDFAVSLASPQDEKVEVLFAEVEDYKETR